MARASSAAADDGLSGEGPGNFILRGARPPAVANRARSAASDGMMGKARITAVSADAPRMVERSITAPRPSMLRVPLTNTTLFVASRPEATAARPAAGPGASSRTEEILTQPVVPDFKSTRRQKPRRSRAVTRSPAGARPTTGAVCKGSARRTSSAVKNARCSSAKEMTEYRAKIGTSSHDRIPTI